MQGHWAKLLQGCFRIPKLQREGCLVDLHNSAGLTEGKYKSRMEPILLISQRDLIQGIGYTGNRWKENSNIGQLSNPGISNNRNLVIPLRKRQNLLEPRRQDHLAEAGNKASLPCRNWAHRKKSKKNNNTHAAGDKASLTLDRGRARE